MRTACSGRSISCGRLMLARPNAGAVRPSASATEPLFSFGVIADVQYADIPDGRSFLGVPRYYRHSIAVLRRAVRSWNAHGGVRFCVNFGDIVDGFCPRDRSLAAVRAVVREFDGFRGGPAYHMLGNHCLYNLPRSELVSELRMPSPAGRAYYDFSPWPGYRFVVLDAYDFSAVGRARGDPVAAAARRFLEARNPNRDKNSPSGLEGAARRFVMFNGGVGGAQLRWLDGVLRGAAGEGRGVQPPAGAPGRGVAHGAHVELRGGGSRGAAARGVRRGVPRRARPQGRVRRGRPRRAPPHAGGRARVPAGHRRLRPRRGLPRPSPARRRRQNGQHGDAAQLIIQ
ncbi:hypothetical protein GQ55_6G287500 [Panicum hallii var. hallii]|uniref:Calcineurin-like phosphoesterase domain-containing protein n=1 Tax=Panicum hallii var. hallii TaxID=1504633 RepID=A0A2T7DAS6_9POAL|nr:hypothetical protein GQ55_6G287500 [Panicum hallii var. hallii]